MLSYNEQAPPLHWKRQIECVWTIAVQKPVSAHRVPPDGCLDILFDDLNGLRAVGAMTTEQRFPLEAGTKQAGIRFRPGMASSFLGLPSSEITDGLVSLEDLWSSRGRRVTEEMRAAGCMEAAMQCLLATLGTRVRVSDLNPVQKAIEWLTASNGTADLEQCAAHANLSIRQFRRRCEQESGLTPKLLARILRFRHACRLAGRVAQQDWSAIAAETMYFDQAHLIRDFRQFTGKTPLAVFSNTASAVSL